MQNLVLALKRLEGARMKGGRGQFQPPCGFSKNVSSRERVKPWFLVNFNIIISHIFPKNFIKILQIVQKV